MANITQDIANIRKAVYGKEVRESIASAIEQCYTDASKNGNANMEVSRARGTYSTLNKRLNENDSVVSKKADKSYVDTKVNAVASGTPIPVSSIDEMTDTTKTYLLTTDGYWYYHNGTTWAKGGVYQATEIQDGSVNLKKLGNDLDFVSSIYKKKVIDYESGSIDGYGTTVSNNARARTISSIYVKKGYVLHLNDDNYLYSIASYDSNNIFISQASYTKEDTCINIENGYIRIALKRVDEATISDFTTLDNVISIIESSTSRDKLDKISKNYNITSQIGYIDNEGIFYSYVEYNNAITDKMWVNNILVSISNKEKYRYKIYYFNDNGSYNSCSSWLSTPSVISTRKLIRIGICLYENLGFGNLKYTASEMAKNLYIIDVDTLDYKISNINNNIADINKKLKNNKYMHLSFDDTIEIFKDLTNNASTYTSIFDNEILKWYKSLHDQYGVVISCYCFNNHSDFKIENTTSKFKDEFKANKDWLKFGHHFEDASGNYATGTAESASASYSKFVNAIYNITGCCECIDRVPRLHNFAGNTESLIAMRDCNCGITGVLGADDTRKNYDLNDADMAYVLKHEKVYDTNTKLTIFTTDIRIENITDINATLTNLSSVNYFNKVHDLIVFTHEWKLTDSTIKANIIKIIEFALVNNYEFDYPMNRI